MNDKPPPFFERIRQQACDRWNGLEKDAEALSLWLKMFAQVQMSSRHVLSELLQNADDAGATKASVRIENGVFTFEHRGGHDFTEDEFESLCRFGFSNKKSFHTIGFRGVGFKSCFSLGDNVDLITPSLKVRFTARRFTEPNWLTDEAFSDQSTCVRVLIKDEFRKDEVLRNLQEWLDNPISLLFFTNVQRLNVNGQLLEWTPSGDGPVPRSRWMLLAGSSEPLLIIESEKIPPPLEAAEEIKSERLDATDDSQPTCQLKIVIGNRARGTMFVVLPTEIETSLPFACNTQFLPDVDRRGIRSPGTSPTNRWLLRELGVFASTSMLKWLEKVDLSQEERARAYSMLPKRHHENRTLADVCASTVMATFEETLKGKTIVLTALGNLVKPGEGVAVPNVVLDTWGSAPDATPVDDMGRSPLSPFVSDEARSKLLDWEFVVEIGDEVFLEALASKQFRTPPSLASLQVLWRYVARVTDGRYYPSVQDLRIVPVSNREHLYAATDVVRFACDTLQVQDRELLVAHLELLDSEWVLMIENMEDVCVLLGKMELQKATDVSKVIDKASIGLFGGTEAPPVDDCVRIAQIAAKLNAKVTESFKYVTRDGELKSAKDHILFDVDGHLEELVPETKRGSSFLHAEYAKEVACSQQVWVAWASSFGFSRLLGCMSLCKTNTVCRGCNSIEEEGRRRGMKGPPAYHNQNYRFLVQDWDFSSDFWNYWNDLATVDAAIWAKVVNKVLAQARDYWESALHAKLLQPCGRSHLDITREALSPSWLLKLREKPCLRDTHGHPRRPDELLRLTPDTVPLNDVALFVHRDLDNETTRPLLDLLGVGSTPPGPQTFVKYLEGLSQAQTLQVAEIEKWYTRLDQMFDACSTEDQQDLVNVFRESKLILTNTPSWESSDHVFLAPDEAVMPGGPVIHTNVGKLSFWRKVGVLDRPNFDRAIEWLNALPCDAPLPTEVIKRIRDLLGRHPVRIWNDCRKWINLQGELTSTASLRYAIATDSSRCGDLFSTIKKKTADLRRLPPNIADAPPFSTLRGLASVMVMRMVSDVAASADREQREWLTTVGNELRRVRLQTDEETRAIREVANRLAQTTWCDVHGVRVVPYIEETPVGTEQTLDLAWIDKDLYVGRLSRAKIAKLVPEEIGGAFGNREITAAITYCYERSTEQIKEYLAGNFELDPMPEPVLPSNDRVQPTDSGDPTLQPTGVIGRPVTPTHPSVPNTLRPGNSYRPAVPIRSEPQSPSPKLIELFAAQQGFRADGRRFVRDSDGCTIVQDEDNRFLWERMNAAGAIDYFYCPKRQCLENGPVELECEAWSHLMEHPDRCSLVLLDENEQVKELTGTRLRELKAAGQLVLHPATYRLIYRYDRRD